MSIPITQSREWQKLQDDLKVRSYFKKGKGFQYLAILKSTPLGKYLYLPYGPVAKDESTFKEALDCLKQFAKEKGVVFIRIESQNPEFASFLPSSAVKSKNLNPADTWLLDLSTDVSQIISNFSQGTRTRFNTYAKKGLVVESTRDPSKICHLAELQKQLFKSKNLSAYDESYLKTELSQPFATLYLVKYERKNDLVHGNELPPNTPKDGQVLAASLFFDYDGTRYYMQSAADTAFKKLPATVALLTRAILDAKKKGLKYFDFWGIAPEGASKDHPWYGFTEFKKSFGGEPRSYLGTYDIVISPLKYRLYTITRRLNQLLKKA